MQSPTAANHKTENIYADNRERLALETRITEILDRPFLGP